jgi:DeoR/GlpR family transcriptional regulator of sugar metabolism
LRVFYLAGELLNRQSVLLGEEACRSLEFWRFDVAFLSAEAMDCAGIWNSQAAVVKQQKAVLRRSARSVFCMNAGKLDGKTHHFLIPWNKVGVLLTDAPRMKLQQAGISIRADHYRRADKKARRVKYENSPR